MFNSDEGVSWMANNSLVRIHQKERRKPLKSKRGPAGGDQDGAAGQEETEVGDWLVRFKAVISNKFQTKTHGLCGGQRR